MIWLRAQRPTRWQKTQAGLQSFFKKRLGLLIDREDLAGFYVEAGNLLSPRTGAEEKRRVQTQLLAPLEGPYLALVRKALEKKLRDTKWRRFESIQVDLETWNPEWLALLGREAPAAVYYPGKRIALRPLEFDPRDLELFLFHELAHLDGATPRDERYAWQQTVEFIDYLEKNKLQVPDTFVSIRQGIRVLGLSTWVRLVVESRQ